MVILINSSISRHYPPSPQFFCQKFLWLILMNIWYILSVLQIYSIKNHLWNEFWWLYKKNYIKKFNASAKTYIINHVLLTYNVKFEYSILLQMVEIKNSWKEVFELNPGIERSSVIYMQEKLRFIFFLLLLWIQIKKYFRGFLGNSIYRFFFG